MTVHALPVPAQDAETLTAHQVMRIARITYRQLDFWTRAGYISALPRTIAVKNRWQGSGYPRTYTPEQANLAAEMGALVTAGIPPHIAAHAAVDLIATGRATLGGYRITREDA